MTSTSDTDSYYGQESHQHIPTYAYPRPLIDSVTNEWQKSLPLRDSSFESHDSYSHFMSEKDGFRAPRFPSWTRQLNIPRRAQRHLIAYVLLLLSAWFSWLYYFRPAWEQERRLDDSLASASKSGSSFGANIRPAFADMIQLETLDSTLVPSGTGPEDKRLVFIGDVHGCSEERKFLCRLNLPQHTDIRPVQKLLDKVNFVKGNDHVIFTGDLIAKGPDSRGAVDIAMKIGASGVRGNHEDRTLLAHNSLTSKVHPLPGPQEDPHKKEDYLDEESFSHGDYKDRALAKLLSADQINWLEKLPVILRVGPVAGMNGGSDIVVAHAGLVPGVDLDRQDPFLVMNMRSIDLKTRVPSEDRKGEPWEKVRTHTLLIYRSVLTPISTAMEPPSSPCSPTLPTHNCHLRARLQTRPQHREVQQRS
jgi:hypothetical protein